MGPTNTLSQKDEIDTGDDNREITLLKGGNQYFHIHAIDTALADKISSSSVSNPIKALAAMNNESGEPWIPQTAKEDWKFVDNALYFKHCLYVLEPAHHDLIKSIHKSPGGGHEGFFRMLHHMQKDYW